MFGTLFCRGHATLHLAVSVGPSVRPSVTFLNCERLLHYCPCQTVRDCPAVYPTLILRKDMSLSVYFFQFRTTFGPTEPHILEEKTLSKKCW